MRAPPLAQASSLDGELDRLYIDHVANLEHRYAAALTAMGLDAVLIHSGSLAKRSAFDDQYWPLRPVPHWQHWLPLAQRDCVLVVRVGRRPKLFLRSHRSFWEKPQPPPSHAFQEAFDIAWVSGETAMDEAKGFVGVGRMAFVGNDGNSPTALVAALDALRVHKTAYEIACLAEANRLARRGHDALRRHFRDADLSELNLHLAYLGATEQDDWETPYKNIVALGENAATLHHIAYGRRSEPREAASLLVDAGASCRGYGADITRTWVKGSGAAASGFAHLIAGLEAMQVELCEQVRVGLAYEDLHDESHRRAAAVLREVGIVRCGVEEAVERGVTRAFYPHGLGHSLGLQTHDVGCALRPARPGNAFLRNTSDVEIGQVFTVEPGIYFIDDLLAPLRAGRDAGLVDWKIVDAFTPLGGVRIEDDLLVTGGSAAVRNLTREHLPSGGGLA